MVATQEIQVGMTHAGKTVTVSAYGTAQLRENLNRFTLLPRRNDGEPPFGPAGNGVPSRASGIQMNT
jgi:hypothetical protein